MSKIVPIVDGKLQLRAILEETMIGSDGATLEGKVIVKIDSFVNGRDGKIKKTDFEPAPLKPFFTNPTSVDVPSTIKEVILIQPLNLEKIEAGDIKGNAVIAFTSSMPHSIGPDTTRKFGLGLTVIDKSEVAVEDITSLGEMSLEESFENLK
jgi:hypothetical protein